MIPSKKKGTPISSLSREAQPSDGYILAIDPSLRSTGYAIVDKTNNRAIDVGRIITTDNISGAERIARIHLEIKQIILNHSEINTLAIEDQFMYKNADTLKKLSQVCGAIILSATLHGIPCYLYSPTQIKKATTGKGNADKNEVYQNIRELHKNNEKVFQILYSPNIMSSGKNKNDDMSDALAIARTHQVLQQEKGNSGD